MRSRHALELLSVLAFHLVGALTWIASLGFSADIGTDRQFHEAVLIGAATWLLALLLIVWRWWSGRSTTVSLWIPVAWWVSTYGFVISAIY
jgi:hypothetical protein